MSLAKKLSGGLSFARWAVTDPAATPRRAFNAIAVYLQFKVLRSAKIWGYPIDVTIEPTNACNLRCPLCPTTEDGSAVPTGLMTLEHFKHLVDRIGPYIYSVELHNWGEPFLNKELPAMIRYATDRRLNVRLSSNMNRFDADLARAVVEAGLEILYVSVDGVDQDVYHDYRVRGSLDRVIENVRLLQKTKAELDKKAPRVIWNYIRTAHNADQVDEARKLAESLGMEFRSNELMINFGLRKTFDESLEEKKSWIPDFDDWKKHRDAMSAEMEKPGFCESPWLRASINWDGTMWPCCYLHDPKDAFGNVLEDDFQTVWNNDAYQQSRNVVANRACGTEHICEFCRHNFG